MSVTLKYISGADNNPVINVRDSNGDVVDFSSASRYVAEFFARDNTANNFTLDTDVTAGLITGTSSGDVTFNMNLVTTLNEDLYQIKLTVYDAGHLNGQVVADNCCGPYICMEVCGSVVASTPPPTTPSTLVTNQAPNVVLSNGDLTMDISDNFFEGAGFSDGGVALADSFYLEFTIADDLDGSNTIAYGISEGKTVPAGGGTNSNLFANGTYTNTSALTDEGTLRTNGTSGSTLGNSLQSGSTYMVAYSNGKWWAGEDGTWFNSGDPAAGTGEIATVAYSGDVHLFLLMTGYQDGDLGVPAVTVNLGATAFTHTPPTGFTAGIFV